MATADDTFETINWEDVSGRPRLPGVRTVGFLVSVVGLVAVFLYDHFAVEAGEPVIWDWTFHAIDWPFALAMLVLGFYVVVPLAQNRRLARHYWGGLRTNRLAVASLLYLVVFFFVGLFGPPALDLAREHTGITAGQTPYGSNALQPPLGFAAPMSFVKFCTGQVSDGLCHGTVYHPLGTTENQADVLVGVVDGARVALAISMTAAILIAPIAIVVGTVAAHFGGRIDEALMRYVDVQQVIPPFFIYILLQVPLKRTFVLLVAVFGLLNWGGTARLVRSEALEKAEAEYMLAARSAGSGSLRTVRRHLIPNVSNTVVTAVTLQLPRLIIIEATLAWLNLSSGFATSWGNMLGGANVFGGTFLGGASTDGIPVDSWWTEFFPVLFLILTVVAFNAFGDALRDVLDPRLGRENA